MTRRRDVIGAFRFTDFEYFEATLAVAHLTKDGIPPISSKQQKHQAAQAPYVALVTLADNEFQAGQRLDGAE